MRSVLVLLALAALLCQCPANSFGQAAIPTRPAPAAAAARTPPRATSSNRFLFIVDTSSNMKREMNDAIRSVMSILRSGAGGRMHPGDTIGLWTFNETLLAGQFPLQTWAPVDGEGIALRAGEFLRQQRLEKSSRLETALAGMQEVIQGSDIIFIFLVSDGSGRIQGTPFDTGINAQLQQALQEMKKNPLPIITVLEAKAGKIVDYTVNPMPWPVVVPELDITMKSAQPPPAAKPVVTRPATVAPAVAAAAPTTVPPKLAPTNTAPAVAATAAPTVTPPAQPPPEPQGATWSQTTVPAVAPVAVSATVAKAENPPETPVPAAKVPPATAPVATATAPQATPKPAEPAPAAVMPPPAATALAGTAPPSTPKPPPTTPGPTVAVVPPRPAQASPPSEKPSVPAALPAVPRPTVATATQSVTTPVPVPAPAPKPTQAAASPKPATPPAPAPATEPATTPDTGSATNSLSAQAVALMKFYTEGPRKYYLMGGVGLLIIGLELIRVMLRRARRPSRISLISQTMQDPEK